MAKKPTVTSISSGYASNTQLNANFEALRDAFDNTLSLDGSTPNAMAADLDLGTNDLLNVGSINGASATGLSANLDTVVGISADITTVAGISADVTQVAADTVAINAASANAAAAAASAGAASTSETNAAASEAAAAASYDSFDDRYLGAKASDPAVDNDGDPLITGALYFNTASGEMRTWNGSAWVAAFVSLSGALLASNNLSDVDSATTALSNLGLSATATEINVLDGITASTAELNTMDGITASTTELNYVSGVTSSIQTQIDNIPTPPELTQVQVEDDTSTVFGQVSGQRLGQAILANASGRIELARTTVTTSVASVDFTAFDASKYTNYYFEFTGVVQSVSARNMLAELSVDGGSTWVTGSNYGGSYMGTDNTTNQADSFTSPFLTGDSVEVDGNIHLARAGDAGRRTRMIYTVVKLTGSTTPFVALGGIMRKVSAVDNGLRLRPETGNFTAGTFVMYGVE